MANKNPNTGPLFKSIEEKQKSTFQKVEAAMKVLIKKQQKINFNSVSDTSGVSKSFLYKYPEIRNRIETLRKQQVGIPHPRMAKLSMSEQSKDVIITSLKKRNKELLDENKKLKEQLKHGLVDFYQNI
jgi:hypothetical protein